MITLSENAIEAVQALRASIPGREWYLRVGGIGVTWKRFGQPKEEQRFLVVFRVAGPSNLVHIIHS